MKIQIFWELTPSRLICRYHHFRGACYLTLFRVAQYCHDLHVISSPKKQQAPPKLLQFCISLQSAIIQKTGIFMSTAVKSLNFTVDLQLRQWNKYIFTFPDFLLKKLIAYEHSNTDFSVPEITVCILSLLLRELNVIKCLEL